MRLARAVVADNENSFALCGVIQVKLRECYRLKGVPKTWRDHERLHQTLGLGLLVCLVNLDDRLNWVEFEQFAIFH